MLFGSHPIDLHKRWRLFHSRCFVFYREENYDSRRLNNLFHKALNNLVLMNKHVNTFQNRHPIEPGRSPVYTQHYWMKRAKNRWRKAWIIKGALSFFCASHGIVTRSSFRLSALHFSLVNKCAINVSQRRKCLLNLAHNFILSYFYFSETYSIHSVGG